MRTTNKNLAIQKTLVILFKGLLGLIYIGLATYFPIEIGEAYKIHPLLTISITMFLWAAPVIIWTIYKEQLEKIEGK